MTAAYGGMGAGYQASTSGTTSGTSSTASSTPTAPESGRKKSKKESYGGLGTLGVAASQAASLGMNQAGAWWAMAQQMAAQEYLTRLQSAARDPAAYAALAAQGVLPNYEMLTQGSKSRSSPKPSRATPTINVPTAPDALEQLKLPSDTEIIKYTSSSGGDKRGRKKAEPEASVSISAATAAPVIPPGLTIERKKVADDKHHSTSNVSTVDKVEITKIPVGNGTPRTNVADFLPYTTASTSKEDSAPLNLSTKSAGELYTSKSSSADGGIPSEYYACKFLGKKSFHEAKDDIFIY